MFHISLVCIRASREDLRLLVWMVLIYKANDLKPEGMIMSLVSGLTVGRIILYGSP